MIRHGSEIQAVYLRSGLWEIHFTMLMERSYMAWRRAQTHLDLRLQPLTDTAE